MATKAPNEYHATGIDYMPLCGARLRQSMDPGPDPTPTRDWVVYGDSNASPSNVLW